MPNVVRDISKFMVCAATCDTTRVISMQLEFVSNIPGLKNKQMGEKNMVRPARVNKVKRKFLRKEMK